MKSNMTPILPKTFLPTYIYDCKDFMLQNLAGFEANEQY